MTIKAPSDGTGGHHHRDMEWPGVIQFAPDAQHKCKYYTLKHSLVIFSHHLTIFVLGLGFLGVRGALCVCVWDATYLISNFVRN